MPVEVRQTEEFADWLAALRDRRAAARINVRIDRAAEGNLGDAKFFGGIGEMRISHGAGYRVYFVKSGDAFVVLLCGGDKSSQDADIKRAKRMAEDLKHG